MPVQVTHLTFDQGESHMKAQREQDLTAPSLSAQFECYSENYTESSSRDTSNSAQPSNSNGTSSPSEEPSTTYMGGSAMSLTNITHAQPELSSEQDQCSKRHNSGIVRKSRVKDGVGDSGVEATPDNMELLALGMIRLFLRYGNESDSSPTSDSPSNSLRSSSDSSSDGSNDRFKHELITTMRDSMPLGYLQDLCKRNEFPAVRWFPCTYPQCFNLYLSKGSQRRHTYSHTGERPYSCQFPGCDKSYSASDRLAEHMHSHTNQRPFRCSAPGCSKAYNDPKTLREHKRTHGDKTFLCNVPSCKKSFHRKTHLKQHLRTHNREEAAGPFMEFEEQETESSVPPHPTTTTTAGFHRSLLNNSTDFHFQVHRSQNSP